MNKQVAVTVTETSEEASGKLVKIEVNFSHDDGSIFARITTIDNRTEWTPITGRQAADFDHRARDAGMEAVVNYVLTHQHIIVYTR